MSNKPAEVLSWGETTVDEFVTIGSSQILVTNVVEPTTELKNTGVLAREKWARSYMNWLFRAVSRWINNLDTRTSYLGKVEITTDNTRTATDYDNEFGGTWTQRANDTIGGVTVYVFERTV